MKRFILAIVVLTLLTAAWAIESIPADGEMVFPPNLRTYTFSYHDGSTDLNWYGSPQWAVLFDFKAVYPSLSLAQFAISGAQIYFPVVGDSATVELFTDNAGQPQTRLAQTRILVNQNLMQFTFPNTIQTEKVWMVLNYTTNYFGPYVSASIGGGSHSYYLNTNVGVPYFQSMASAGFNCEFLMSVQGEFLLSNQDLELQSFELEGDLIPGAPVAPKFTIYNHSTTTINNAQIDLHITAPIAAAYTYDATIPITNSIPPHSALSVDFASAEYQSHHFNLPENPMQIKVKALLSSENAADTLFNNNKTVYYNIFEYDNPLTLCENFVRNSELEMIAAAQNSSLSDDLQSLYYFPILADSLSNLGSVNRYSWYSLFSTPVTVLGGSSKISGYSNNYQDQFNQVALTHQQDTSPINSSQATFELPQEGENLRIDISLRNVSTHLFNNPTEPNLLSSSRFFVAFFKKTDFLGRQLYVFNRWIAYADTISGSLYFGQSAQKSYTTSLSNIDINDLAQNYRLFYWLQVNGGGQILYANYSDLNTVLDNEDELLAPPVFTCYPNPLRGDRNLFIKAGSASISSSYSIFNLRGQRIWKSETISKTELPIEVPRIVFKGSGIYFIRSESRSANGQTSQYTKKISVLN